MLMYAENNAIVEGRPQPSLRSCDHHSPRPLSEQQFPCHPTSTILYTTSFVKTRHLQIRTPLYPLSVSLGKHAAMAPFNIPPRSSLFLILRFNFSIHHQFSCSITAYHSEGSEGMVIVGLTSSNSFEARVSPPVQHPHDDAGWLEPHLLFESI